MHMQSGGTWESAFSTPDGPSKPLRYTHSHTPSLFGRRFITMVTKHKKERPWNSRSVATAERAGKRKGLFRWTAEVWGRRAWGVTKRRRRDTRAGLQAQSFKKA